MNREQRRAMQKKTGLSFDEIKAVENLAEIKAGQGTPLTIPTLPDGQPVKLNLQRIFALKDFAVRPARWRKFVQESRDKVYTVEHDPRFGNESSLVCLKEDPSEVKRLWHVSDLEVVA